MKAKIITVVAVLLLLLNLNVCAASAYEYKLSLGDDFTSVSYGDDLSAVAQKLGMTVENLNGYFSKNGLLYLAVSSDNKTQIRLSAFTDNFSSAVGDISKLDQNGLDEFKSSVSKGNEDAFYTQSDQKRKFIAVKNTLKDSGGVYTVTQYITVCDSQIFYLSCYNEGEETSDEVKSVFKNFELYSAERHDTIDEINALRIAVIAGIAVFSVVSVVMTVGIIKSAKRKNNNGE